ncbi:MAG: hypothetical protein M0P31_18575 [Solirubrobacteraceae bacterium]|nr:hypothetical protein [Solirubrobacteraceae bacterium]
MAPERLLDPGRQLRTGEGGPAAEVPTTGAEGLVLRVAQDVEPVRI